MSARRVPDIIVIEAERPKQILPCRHALGSFPTGLAGALIITEDALGLHEDTKALHFSAECTTLSFAFQPRFGDLAGLRQCDQSAVRWAEWRRTSRLISSCFQLTDTILELSTFWHRHPPGHFPLCSCKRKQRHCHRWAAYPPCLLQPFSQPACHFQLHRPTRTATGSVLLRCRRDRCAILASTATRNARDRSDISNSSPTTPPLVSTQPSVPSFQSLSNLLAPQLERILSRCGLYNMRLSLVSLALLGLAANHALAFPASLGDVKRNTDHAPYFDTDKSALDPDLTLGPDMLGSDDVDEFVRRIDQVLQSYEPDLSSFGLGPVPGFWPGHRHGDAHNHGPPHAHEDGHKDQGHQVPGSRPINGKPPKDTCKPKPPSGVSHKCEKRDFTPQTREFDWTITYGHSAPDGFLKKRILVNGQSPGPLIEANEGDTIVVKVRNLLDQGTSIHWHGMFQNSTPFMDGIAGFSQCPIPPRGHLTYRFKIEGQYGSYWWHSHSKMQYTDGLYGGLIVHSKRDPYQKCRDYDDERVFLFADNYHDFADYIVQQLLSANGYNGTAAAPSPQSGLINGAGQFNCAALAHAKGKQPGMPTRCTQLPTPTMDVEPNKKYRFRFINTGSHAQHIISIDNHELEVIAADGTPVKPHKVHRVPIHNGQRHDVFVDTNQGSDGDSFLLRSAMMTACFSFVDPLLDPVANLTLQYRLPGSKIAPKRPVPHDWKDAMGSQCQDLKDSELVPAIDTSVPPNHNLGSLGIFNSQFGNLQLANGTTLGRFFVDNVTQTNYVNKPYLEVTHAGGQINSSTVASLLIPDDVWVADIVINNEDSFLDHPFHLHATDMHIVARGSGSMTQAQWIALNQNAQPQNGNASALNLKNPLRRDTITVPRSSFVVVRIIPDLPGVWAMHCHIAMHVAEGLMAAIAIHPHKIRELKFSQEVLDLCLVSRAALNEVEPA